jgi:protein-disulfide isomerase
MNNRIFRAGLAAGALALTLTSAAVAQQSPAGDNQPLARVGERTITRAEVLKAAAPQLDQAEMQFLSCKNEYERNRHGVVENFTRDLMRQELVAREAKALGKSASDVIAGIKPKDLTDAAIDQFYEENKARIPANMTKEQVAPQIREYLGQQLRAEATEDFYKALEKKHNASFLVEPLRATVAPTGPAKGPASAPVTIVEFSDFQCPFCRTFNPTLDKVRKEFGDKVRIVFRQYPLTQIHPQAQKAAEASLCADDQGKFWEMHDAMFAAQTGLAPEQLKAKAVELKLDATKFNACLDSGKYAQRVNDDLRAGAQAGVSGTPATFVNGRFLNGAVPYEDMAELIREELSRAGGKPPSSR